MGDPAVEAVNSYTMEVRCRRLYGIEKVFELVECEKHWRQPRGEEGKKWKSRVRWELAQQASRRVRRPVILLASSADLR